MKKVTKATIHRIENNACVSGYTENIDFDGDVQMAFADYRNFHAQDDEAAFDWQLKLVTDDAVYTD